MKLGFKVCQIKEGNLSYAMLIRKMGLNNEFIIIGEEDVKGYENCYKALSVSNEGIKLISALTLHEQALEIPKSHLQVKKDILPGIEMQEFDIPKEYLTIDIIEDIKRLNEV